MIKISKEDALRLIDGSSKYSHSILCGRLMKTLARIFRENGDEWELTGLLHDLDLDLIGDDMSKHGILAAEMLRDKLSDEALHAIKSHDRNTGVKPRSLLDESLIFIDSLATLIKDQAITSSVNEVGLIQALEDESETKPWISHKIRKFSYQKDFSIIKILEKQKED